MKSTKLLMLILIFAIVLSIFGCTEDQNPSYEHLKGTWILIDVSISGELENIDDRSANKNISISIPEALTGQIVGQTFANSIVAEYEIKDNQKIVFKNYGGSEVLEDKWGMAFSENLLNTVEYIKAGEKLHFLNSRNQIILVFTKSSL